jgi:hypothetical protein
MCPRNPPAPIFLSKISNVPFSAPVFRFGELRRGYAAMNARKICYEKVRLRNNRSWPIRIMRRATSSFFITSEQAA